MNRLIINKFCTGRLINLLTKNDSSFFIYIYKTLEYIQLMHFDKAALSSLMGADRTDEKLQIHFYTSFLMSLLQFSILLKKAVKNGEQIKGKLIIKEELAYKIAIKINSLELSDLGNYITVTGLVKLSSLDVRDASELKDEENFRLVINELIETFLLVKESLDEDLEAFLKSYKLRNSKEEKVKY